jgi:hypothetical protein
MTHDGNAIDIVYRIPCGATKTAISIDIQAYLNSNNDAIDIQVYDQIGLDWETLDTLVGINGSTLTEKTLRVFNKHTGVFGGAYAGQIFVRFVCTAQSAPNLFTATLSADAIGADAATSYELGRLWINTNATTNTNTEPGIDGRASNPVTTVAALDILKTKTGIQDTHVINGSSLVLESDSSNQSFFGDGWTLGLGGQECSGLYIVGATVSGIGTAATGKMHFEGCDITTASVQSGQFDFCVFYNTLTMTLAGNYKFLNCHSGIEGPGAPEFTKTAGQTILSAWRKWSDSLTVSGVESGDTMTINGTLGAITLTGADGTAEIRGTYKSITDSRTGSPSLNTDGAVKGADVADILVDTAEIGVAGAGLTEVELSATGLDSIVSTSTGMIEISKAVWDRILSKANHNIGLSAGKLVRQEAAVIVTDGTAQAGSINTITLAAGESAVDEQFFDQLIYIEDGTGVGQSHHILKYVGATKVATIDGNWVIAPDATSDYIIYNFSAHEWADAGVLVAATSTTVTLNGGASTVDDYYRDMLVYMASGTGSGQAMRIKSYVGATKVATLARAWGTTPDATTGYIVLPQVSPDNESIALTLEDTNEIQGKLPTNEIMGSSTKADKDDEIDSIVSTLGVAGAGLTDLGGMSTSMKAEVNAECDTALTDYDGPTNAEMEARTPTAAQLAYVVSNSADGVPVTFSGGTTTTAVIATVDGVAASTLPNDALNGRILIFPSTGTLKNQATDITDWDQGTSTATITAVTTAVTSSHTANMK